MPLVAQSLKIEFSHNNCALQEALFSGMNFTEKVGLPGLCERKHEEELVYQASLKGKMKKN